MKKFNLDAFRIGLVGVYFVFLKIETGVISPTRSPGSLGASGKVTPLNCGLPFVLVE